MLNLGYQQMVLPDPWVPLNELQQVRGLSGLTGVNAGQVVNTNNDAHLIPVTFPCDCSLYAIYLNATNATGNYDLGLYDSALRRLTSKGSTAMANAIQTHSFSDMRVRAGDLYYLAAAFSSTAGNASRYQWATTGLARGVGFGIQASALPLPDPFVPASYATYSFTPVLALGVR